MDGEPAPPPPSGPTGLSTRPAARRGLRVSAWPIVLTGLFCLLLTHLVSRTTRQADGDLAQQAFARECLEVGAWVQARRQAVVDTLYALRALVLASDRVDHDEWPTFVASLHLGTRAPGLLGVGWVVPVAREDLPAFEAAQNAARGPEETFRVRTAAPPPPGPAYVVQYVAPERSNASSLGLDLRTFGDLGDTLDRARDTGEFQTSRAFDLPPEKGEIGDPRGVVCVLPVWPRDRRQGTEEERRASLQGWAVAIVHLESAFQRGRPLAPAIALAIEERGDDGPPREILDASGPGAVPGSDLHVEPERVPMGGRTWWLRFSAAPGYDPAGGRRRGGLVLFLGLAVGALVTGVLYSLLRTQRRAERLAQRMTASLRTSEARLRGTLETVPDGLVVVDDAGRVQTFNPSAERIFGWEAAQVLGRDVRVLFDPDSSHVADDTFGAGDGATGHGGPVEARARRRDGTVFTAEVHARATQAEGRSYVTALFRDVTERQRHLAELEDRRARIERQAKELASQATALQSARDDAMAAARAKGEFLAAVSHEIRTPLNGVHGMAHLLLESGLSPEQEEFARTIRSSADALLAILNDILDVSKIEAGRIELESSPFDLRAACEDVLDLLAPEAAGKGLDLVLRYAPGTPRRFVGDAGRVRQILLNLAQNAVKFTERGHVLLDVSASEGRLDVRVEDTGIGIDPAKVRLLFRRFAQGDTSTTRRFGGTGLGLLISRLLVERMGGTIGVDSRPGEGSTFRFSLRLPLDPGAPPPGAQVRVLAGRRVLFAGGAEVARRVRREEAEAAGAEVGEAARVEDVVVALREGVRAGRPAEVAWLDGALDAPDVLDAVRAVRADPAWASVALGLLAKGPRPGGARAAQDAGLDAYLVAPVHAEDLLEATATLAGRRGAPRPEFVTRQGLAQGRRSVTDRDAAAEEAAPARHRRVLLAEDNAVNVRIATRMLERLGCTVDVAANGREAIEMVDRFPYDLVLMDCSMPDTDGYQATAEIRRREAKGRRVPVVALTAHALDEDRRRCLDAGMDDYVRKPVSPEDLRRALRTWAGGAATPGSPTPGGPPP